MDIHIVRHTSVATSGICYGHHDVPLAPTFAEEVALLRQKLPADLSRMHVFSSPSQRCKALAHELGVEHVHVDTRLMELNFGRWENQAWDSIAKDDIDRWSGNFVRVSPPGGESFQELALRCESFWRELRAASPQQALIITHAGWMRALLSHILELPLQNAFRLHIDYGGVARIRWRDGAFQVVCMNR